LWSLFACQVGTFILGAIIQIIASNGGIWHKYLLLKERLAHPINFHPNIGAAGKSGMLDAVLDALLCHLSRKFGIGISVRHGIRLGTVLAFWWLSELGLVDHEMRLAAVNGRKGIWAMLYF
jgi:hypothetical protein